MLKFLGKWSLILSTLFLQFSVVAQGGEEDHESLDWLKDNLTYAYHNSSQGKWWLNKFQFNAEKGTIHIQNASTVNPRKFSGKSWIDRRVHLSNLDPYGITISPVPENKGRIVKGRVLVIPVVHNEKKIAKALDGQRVSSESFLQFSIPYQMEDTLRGFADSVKYHLQDAIEAYSRLFFLGNEEEDVEQVFKALKGEFLHRSVTRKYTTVFPSVVEFEDKLGSKPIRKGFLGYDANTRLFYEVFVEDSTLTTYHYDWARGIRLTLQCVELPERKIELTSLLHYQLITGDEMTEFRRLSY